MNRLGKNVGLVIGLLAVGAYWAIEAATEPSDPRSRFGLPSERRSDDSPTRERGNLAPLGVASCAAQGCHGDPNATLPSAQSFELAEFRPDDSWRSSYLQWSNHDRHGHAFETLQNERSKRIMLRLTEGKTNDATGELRCLACHVNPTLAYDATNLSKRLHKDGVSCEACHGNAGSWRDEHVTWTPKTDRNVAYDAAEMTKLYDLGVRAETCVGCHVGAPASRDTPFRDVNHDLIAAGHPRLNFEFATYLRKLPPHWKEKDRIANAPRPAGYEAQVWLVGQAANAAASLKLLEARAQLASEAEKTGAPVRWPEFAEFNCYVCHHDLKPDGWRGKSAYHQGRKVGGLVWNRPTAFGANAGDADIASALQKLDSVEAKLLASLRANPESLSGPVDEAANDWRKLRRRFAADDPIAGSIPRLVNSLRRNDDFWNRLDWDQAAQLYYAIVALENAGNDRRRRNPEAFDDGRAERIITNLYSELKLRREPARFDSPNNFAPDKVRDEFKKWFALPKRDW